MAQIFRELTGLMEAGKPCALATLVAAHGSSPQNAGAKIIFLPDGRIIGTIGGGCMEAEARRVGLDALRDQRCRLFDLRLDDDFGWDDGLICGGSVSIFVNPNPARSAAAYQEAIRLAEQRGRGALCTVITGDRAGESTLIREEDARGPLGDAVQAALESGVEKRMEVGDEAVFIEPILPRPTLLILGAGHVGTALAQMASLCGFEVVVVDDRPVFANSERLPFADRVVAADIPKFVRDFPIHPDTYIVIVTRGHRHDAHCLRECIHSTAKYIGMIGSKRKIVVIYEELLREGLATAEELRRVHAPLGLTLGDREVGEIAVSILAELIAVRRGADLSNIRSMQYTPPFLREEGGDLESELAASGKGRCPS